MTQKHCGKPSKRRFMKMKARSLCPDLPTLMGGTEPAQAWHKGLDFTVYLAGSDIAKGHKLSKNVEK
jgi:hypothetical protein